MTSLDIPTPSTPRAAAPERATLAGVRKSDKLGNLVTSIGKHQVAAGLVLTGVTALALVAILGFSGVLHQIPHAVSATLLTVPASIIGAVFLVRFAQDKIKNKANDTKLDDITKKTKEGLKEIENTRPNSWAEIQNPKTRVVQPTTGRADDTPAIKSLDEYRKKLEELATPIAQLLHSELEGSPEQYAATLDSFVEGSHEDAVKYLKMTVAHKLIELKLNAVDVKLFNVNPSGAVEASSTPFDSTIIENILNEVTNLTGFTSDAPLFTTSGNRDTVLDAQALTRQVAADRNPGSLGRKLKDEHAKAVGKLLELTNLTGIKAQVDQAFDEQVARARKLETEIAADLATFKTALAIAQRDTTLSGLVDELNALMADFQALPRGARDIAAIDSKLAAIETKKDQIKSCIDGLRGNGRSLTQAHESVVKKFAELKKITNFIHSDSPCRARAMERVPQVEVIVSQLHQVKAILGDRVSDQSLEAANNLSDLIDANHPEEGSTEEKARKAQAFLDSSKFIELSQQVKAFGLGLEDDGSLPAIDYTLVIPTRESEANRAKTAELHQVGVDVAERLQAHLELDKTSAGHSFNTHCFYVNVDAAFLGEENRPYEHGGAKTYIQEGRWMSNPAAFEKIAPLIKTALEVPAPVAAPVAP